MEYVNHRPVKQFLTSGSHRSNTANPQWLSFNTRKRVRYAISLLFLLMLLPLHLNAQTISWTGNGDGSTWNQAANWSENRVPDASDDVAITLDGTYTVNQATGNITINSLTLGGTSGVQTLVKTSGSFSLTTASTIGENGVLTMRSGYIVGDGTLTNNGLIISESSNWSGLNGFSLINNGTIEQLDGIFYMTSGATLENNGLFDVRGDNNILISGAGSVFINNNRFLKSETGDGFTNITVPFDNRPGSTFETEAGEIRLQSTSSHYNTTFIVNNSDAEIRLQSGVQTFRGTISGDPTGTLTLNGPSEAHSDGATFDFGGTGLNWTSNYMQSGGTFTNDGLIRLNATGWTGVNASTFINNGTVEQLRGIFYITSGATVENNGLFDIQGDNDILISGAGSIFINNNQFLKSVTGDGFTNITVPFNSRPGSTIESAAGQILLQGSSTHHNTTFIVDNSDAEIRFQSGVQTFRGTISGAPSGLVTLNAPSEAHIEGATFDFGGTGLTWTSNYMQGGGTFTNDGLIRLNATGWTGVNASTFINNDTVEQLDGIFYMTSGATVENNGLFDVQGDENLLLSGAGSIFINNNRFLKSAAGDGFTNITVPFNSTPESIIESSAGEIRLQGRSTYHDTEFIAGSESSIIQLFSNEHTFRGTITGSPVGQVIINSNIVADNDDGATWNFGGNGLTWVSSYLMSGGVLTNAGLVTLDANAWTGLNNATMINEGEIIQKRGIIYLNSSSVMENNGLYRAEGGSGILQSGALSSFLNNDRLIFESSSDPYSITTNIENSSSSTLTVLSGNVRLNGGGTHTSPAINVSEGASLAFYSGTHTFNGALTTQPEGDLILRSNFGSDTGSAQFNVGGTGLRWENGLQQSGTITSTGTITIPGSGTTGIDGGVFENSGTITMTGGNFRINPGSEFRNIASFEVTGNFSFISTVQDPGRFINSGLFHKSGGDGISQVRADVINEPNGEIRLTAGTLRLLSDFNHNPNGLLTGTGALDLAWSTSSLKGVVAPGSPLGTLTYTGDFEPNDTTAVLNVLLHQTEGDTPEPASTMLSVKQTDYRVNFRFVGGTATLAGELRVETDTDFIPEPDTEFEILRASEGITGGFSSYTGLVDLVNQRSYYPQVRDTSLFLITSDVIPSLSGPIQAVPLAIQAGEQQMVTFTGSGFPPDLAVELTCLECLQPERFGTIAGRVGSISPDTALVWFDVSNPLISGTYDAVLSDPRGGQETLTIQINQGPPALTVLSFDPVINIQSTDPGRLIIQADRIMDQDLSIPVTISGSARIYEDYVSDFSGSRALIQSGSDRFVMNVFPTSNSESDGPRTVSLSISSSDDYTLESSFSTVTIAERPQTAAFDIYAIAPSYGGTGGSVSSEIVGTGIAQNATVKLVKGGSEIQGTNVNVRENGSALTTTFQLSDTELGFWNVIVTNEGGESKEIIQGFTVVNRVRHSVVADIIAPPRVARGRNNLYKLSFRNTGNNDVLGIPGLVGLPADATWEIINRTSGDTDVSFDDFVTTHTSGNNRKSLRFWPMRIPPGATVNLDIQIAMPNTGLVRFRPVWFGS